MALLADYSPSAKPPVATAPSLHIHSRPYATLPLVSQAASGQTHPGLSFLLSKQGSKLALKMRVTWAWLGFVPGAAQEEAQDKLQDRLARWG